MEEEPCYIVGLLEYYNGAHGYYPSLEVEVEVSSDGFFHAYDQHMKTSEENYPAHKVSLEHLAVNKHLVCEECQEPLLAGTPIDNFLSGYCYLHERMVSIREVLQTPGMSLEKVSKAVKFLTLPMVTGTSNKFPLRDLLVNEPGTALLSEQAHHLEFVELPVLRQKVEKVVREHRDMVVERCQELTRVPPVNDTMVLGHAATVAVNPVSVYMDSNERREKVWLVEALKFFYGVTPYDWVFKNQYDARLLLVPSQLRDVLSWASTTPGNPYVEVPPGYDAQLFAQTTQMLLADNLKFSLQEAIEKTCSLLPVEHRNG